MKMNARGIYVYFYVRDNSLFGLKLQGFIFEKKKETSPIKYEDSKKLQICSFHGKGLIGV